MESRITLYPGLPSAGRKVVGWGMPGDDHPDHAVHGFKMLPRGTLVKDAKIWQRISLPLAVTTAGDWPPTGTQGLLDMCPPSWNTEKQS